MSLGINKSQDNSTKSKIWNEASLLLESITRIYEILFQIFFLFIFN